MKQVDGAESPSEPKNGRPAMSKRFLISATAALAVILAVIVVVMVNHRSDSDIPAAELQQSVTVDYPIIWPPALVGGKAKAGSTTDDPEPITKQAPVAKQFLDALAIPTSGLTFTVEHDSRGEARLVKVTNRDDRVLGIVSLHWDTHGEAWGVQAVQSPRTTVRSPGLNDVANSPLWVAFRTDSDDTARIRLFDARNSKELANWSVDVDPDEDWYANANFATPATPLPGYLVLTTQDSDGKFTSAVVIPQRIGVRDQ